MRDLLASLIGVPATVLVAGGLGIVGVTIVSWVRPRSPRPPIRPAHLVFGVALAGVGLLLLQVDVAVVMAR